MDKFFLAMLLHLRRLAKRRKLDLGRKTRSICGVRRLARRRRWSNSGSFYVLNGHYDLVALLPPSTKKNYLWLWESNPSIRLKEKTHLQLKTLSYQKPLK